MGMLVSGCEWGGGGGGDVLSLDTL